MEDRVRPMEVRLGPTGHGRVYHMGHRIAECKERRCYVTNELGKGLLARAEATFGRRDMPETKTEYTIAAGTLEAMIKEVQQLKDEGWDFHGPLTMAYGLDAITGVPMLFYAREMVRQVPTAPVIHLNGELTASTACGIMQLGIITTKVRAEVTCEACQKACR